MDKVLDGSGGSPSALVLRPTIKGGGAIAFGGCFFFIMKGIYGHCPMSIYYSFVTDGFPIKVKFASLVALLCLVFIKSQQNMSSLSRLSERTINFL